MKALLVQRCWSQSDLKLQEEGKKETAAESLMLGEAVAEGGIHLHARKSIPIGEPSKRGCY